MVTADRKSVKARAEYGSDVLESASVHPAYKKLVDQTDVMAARLAARYSMHLACRAGCSACCHHHLSVFPVEAAALFEAVGELPRETRALIEARAEEAERREAGGETAACPLLLDDRCAVYAARPLICRTQGLPLIYEAEDGESEVDVCPLNFTAPEATNDLDENNLVPLDILNLKLAAVNLDYCRERGLTSEQSARRTTIAGIVKMKD